mgnify:CR=1 FL=1
MLSQRGMICCSWVRFHRLRGRYAPILFSSCALGCSRAAFQVSCDYLLLCGAIDSCVVVCFVVFDWFIHRPDSLLGSHAKHYTHRVAVLCSQILSGNILFLFLKCKGRPKYKNMTSVFNEVLANDGPIGFYRGITANFMKAIPATAITYVCFEKSKRMFAPVFDPSPRY